MKVKRENGKEDEYKLGQKLCGRRIVEVTFTSAAKIRDLLTPKGRVWLAADVLTRFIG